MADLADALRKRADDMMTAALYGTTTVEPTAPAEPFTIDTLRAMMDKLPPRETWLSSVLFPREKAVHLKTRRENWSCAHPDFWMQAMAHIATLPEQERPGLLGSFAPTIVNIDHDECDDEYTKQRKNRERNRYSEALSWSIRSRELLSKVVVTPAPAYNTGLSA